MVILFAVWDGVPNIVGMTSIFIIYMLLVNLWNAFEWYTLKYSTNDLFFLVYTRALQVNMNTVKSQVMSGILQLPLESIP